MTLKLGRDTKSADIRAIRVDCSMPKLIERALATALDLKIKEQKKQMELIKAQKLRMDWLEVTLEDHGENIKALTVRVDDVESKGGANTNTSSIKDYINVLKKEVAALKLTDISSLWVCLNCTRGF